MKSLRFLFFALCFSLPCSADDVAELVERVSPFSSWQAKFQQQIFDENSSLLQTTSGVLKAQKPYQLHWQAEEPFPETIVCDGQQLWRYDPDLEQVIIEQLGEDLQQAPVLVFSGDAEKIRQQYHVKKLNNENNRSVFSLTPKDENNLFVRLEFSLDDQQIYYLSIEDTLGQTSTTNFSDFTTTPSFPDATFTFQVPEGVEQVVHDE